MDQKIIDKCFAQAAETGDRVMLGVDDQERITSVAVGGPNMTLLSDLASGTEEGTQLMALMDEIHDKVPGIRIGHVPSVSVALSVLTALRDEAKWFEQPTLGIDEVRRRYIEAVKTSAVLSSWCLVWANSCAFGWNQSPAQGNRLFHLKWPDNTGNHQLLLIG